jgi:hypothetical protein
MLEFMLPDHPPVECFNEGQRGNQWDLWSGLPAREGEDAVFIDIKPMPEMVRARFVKVEEVPGAAPFVVGEPDRPVKKWWVYRCEGWKAR